MEILRNSDQRVMAYLGIPPIKQSVNYRLLKYLVQLEVDGGLLVFNTLTRAIIKLQLEEIPNTNNIDQYEFLYHNYFYVEESFDERVKSLEIRNNLTMPIDSTYLNHPSSFTVLTTTKCNARCFYCYEKVLKNKKHMTEETALKVAQYINTSSEGQPIHINWFGGEPLFNMNVIDIIDNKLSDFGQTYTNGITTNGYLFNKSLIYKAINEWHLGSAQITIDGTEEVYNKVKNYIYKDSISPYKKVLNNIAMLLNNNIAVQIRLNVDNYNGENLLQLVEDLYNRFKLHPNLVIYTWPIFEDETYHRTPEQHTKVFEYIFKIENKLQQYGYYIGKYPEENLPSYQCMADDGKSVLIGVNGELGVCEHYTDTNFWGNINNPYIKDFDKLRIWREYTDELDICQNCPLYPQCIRPKDCSEMGQCDEQYKKWRIYHAEVGLSEWYENLSYNQNRSMFPVKLAENVI